MPDYFKSIQALAAFSGDKSTKTDLFASGQMFVGLNCFEPGQSQKTHVHAGSDKFYLVVSGKARMVVGTDTRDVEPGTVVWAPADVPHGVLQVTERTVMLVAIAPPPHSGQASVPPAT
jgi:mannose-6-phosphate isomerase-like protein (cupin superfamily)